MKVFAAWFGALFGLGTVSMIGYIVFNMNAETRAVILVGGFLLIGSAAFAITWRLLSIYGDSRKPTPAPTVPMLAPAQHQPPIIIVGGSLPYQHQQQALQQPGTVDWAARSAPVDLDGIFTPMEGDAQ